MPTRSSSFAIVAPQRWQLPHPETWSAAATPRVAELLGERAGPIGARRAPPPSGCRRCCRSTGTTPAITPSASSGAQRAERQGIVSALGVRIFVLNPPWADSHPGDVEMTEPVDRVAAGRRAPAHSGKDRIPARDDPRAHDDADDRPLQIAHRRGRGHCARTAAPGSRRRMGARPFEPAAMSTARSYPHFSPDEARIPAARSVLGGGGRSGSPRREPEPEVANTGRGVRMSMASRPWAWPRPRGACVMNRVVRYIACATMPIVLGHAARRALAAEPVAARVEGGIRAAVDMLLARMAGPPIRLRDPGAAVRSACPRPRRCAIWSGDHRHRREHGDRPRGKSRSLAWLRGRSTPAATRSTGSVISTRRARWESAHGGFNTKILKHPGR